MFKLINIGCLKIKSKIYSAVENWEIWSWSYYRYRSVRSFFINIKIGIENIVFYLPTIWKDRDYDYFFIHAILKEKLRKIQRFYESERAIPHEKDDEILAQIKELVQALTRLEDPSNYTEGLYPELDEYYSSLDFSRFDMHDPDNPRGQFLAELVKASSAEEERRIEEDLDFIYSTLRSNIRRYWN